MKLRTYFGLEVNQFLCRYFIGWSPGLGRLAVLGVVFLGCLSPDLQAAGLEITKNPDSQITFVGKPATFSVRAKGAQSISYQWKKDGVSISGATKSVYSIRKTSVSDRGYYTVVVSARETSVTSEKSVLFVQSAYSPESEDFSSSDSGKGLLLPYGEEEKLLPEISGGAWHVKYKDDLTVDSEETAYWAWGKSPQLGTSFDVRVDGHDTTGGKLQFAASGFGGLSYRIERNGGDANFNAGHWGDPPIEIARVPFRTSSTTFSFRLVYDAVSKVKTLKAYYDEDGAVGGENWVLLQTVTKPRFLRGNLILIGICYNNAETGEFLDGSNVTADNFQAK